MSKPKPWLSPDEQVQQLKDKGVMFRLKDESFAASYLMNNDTYFRIRSYRTNFAKHASGPNDGKYIRLDFAMLVDLATIDMYL